MPDFPLNWQPVLLLKVTREPFTGARCRLHVSRAHIAEHPHGLVCAAWNIPLNQRRFPHIRLIKHDTPLRLPLKFTSTTSTIIPEGTWLLPYDAEQFRVYFQLQQTLAALLTRIDSAPHAAFTLGFVRRMLSPLPHSPNLN